MLLSPSLLICLVSLGIFCVTMFVVRFPFSSLRFVSRATRADFFPVPLSIPLLHCLDFLWILFSPSLGIFVAALAAGPRRTPILALGIALHRQLSSTLMTLYFSVNDLKSKAGGSHATLTFAFAQNSMTASSWLVTSSTPMSSAMPSCQRSSVPLGRPSPGLVSRR